MASSPEKLNFRLVLLGSVGTGKTSILNRFLFQKYLDKYRPTVEDLFTKDFDLGTLMLRVDFLDTSGSMQFPAMRRLSITTGSAFLIVYSVDDLTSFQLAKQCIEEIQETRSDYQEIPIIFAGNKCDIPVEHRLVKKEDVIDYVFCDLPRLRVKVMECSCKDNNNINELFKAYLTLARIPISTITTDGGLKRRSSAQASGKWRLGSFVGGNTDTSEKNSSTNNLANNNASSGSNNNCSNCNKTTVALIKSVTDATGSTLNRVGRSLQSSGQTSGGSSGSATCTPTHSHFNLSCSSSSIIINDNQSAMIDSSHENLLIGEDNGQGLQQHQVVATKSQPISAHLSLNQRVKPRSRSLMRRSTRKSKVRDQEDVTQCLPS